MARTDPQYAALSVMTEGDHLDWPGISSEDQPQGITKFRASFRNATTNALACTLTTDAVEAAATVEALPLTLSDSATWTVDAVKIPATQHNLVEGTWNWDGEVTLADGAILTIMKGVLTVRKQYTLPP